MKNFEYWAKDKNSKSFKGLVEARDKKQAVRELHEKGLWVIDLQPPRKTLISGLKETFFQRVKDADKVNFTRQLATMMTAGLPITDSLALLEKQASPAMTPVISQILREVESGGSLTSVLEKKPEIFDKIYLALVRAGEAAGVMGKILTRLADNLEKQKELKARIKGAMVYPVIIILGMIGVMIVMILFVLPQLKGMFEQFNVELPLATRILLGVSGFATKYFYLVIMMLAGLVVGWLALSKKKFFQEFLDRLLFKVPIIGNLRRKLILTEFTRTLGLLAGAGVLLIEAMNIIRASLGVSIYGQAVKQVTADVEKGLPLAAALEKAEVFPPLLTQMVAVGEETGKIDEVLAKVSSYFEQEANNAVKNLTTAMEPLIMVVLGLGVGFLAVAIIMPIYNLTSQF